MKKIIVIFLVTLFTFCLQAKRAGSDSSTPQGFFEAISFNAFFLNGANSTSTATSTATSTSTSTITSTGTSITAPTSLSYTNSSNILFAGTNYTINTQTLSGTITSCSATPSLPTGLTISSTTCVISGTPTTGTLAVSYTITASNSAGNTSTSIIIKVQSTTSILVYGQSNSFSSNVSNNGGVSTTSLWNPDKTVIDSNGNLYVSDLSNNRVLYFPSGSTTATRVYGQGGNFTSNTANNGGITANSLNGPQGIALDSSGNLYIADVNNNRVLYFVSGSTTASRVYGQAGSFISGTANNGGITANSLLSPSDVAIDPSGNVYIVDGVNHRVLYYSGSSTTASRVYGQYGSYTCNINRNNGSCVTGTTSASNLWFPTYAAVDSSGNLYVEDFSNNRILYYPSGSTTPTAVYGQGGNFTTNTANNGGLSTNSLSSPTGIALDSSGNLYVADRGNYRVLYYPSGSTTATRVLGQFGSFSCGVAYNNGSCINGGVGSANNLIYPGAVGVDSSGNIYVSDAQRLLLY